MMTDERHDDDAGSADDGAVSGDRRDFIKKLAYVAPVVQTFLLSEGVLASGNQRGNQRSQRNQRRKHRGVSPNPGQGKPPPPPPGDDDD